MKERKDKAPENKRPVATNQDGQSQIDGETKGRFKDNRPETAQLKKIQEMANDGAQLGPVAQLLVKSTNNAVKPGDSFQKKKKNATITVNSVSPVLQKVLKDPSKSGTEAKLIQKYHDEEKDGRKISLNSQEVEEQRTAAEHFRKARDYREQANAMHIKPDDGHLKAIRKVHALYMERKSKIRELTAGPKKEKRGKPDWFGTPAPGTANQASWITGQSAWEPRKKGT